MKRRTILASLGFTISLAAPSAVCQVVTRVSVGGDSQEASTHCHVPAISSDGRYVAFDSSSSNLVPCDSNGVEDVFVRDRLAGTTTIVSVDSLGHASNGTSFNASMSSDGRFVAFQSYATSLTPGPRDAILDWDVYVHDRLTGITVLASVGLTGLSGNAGSWQPSISADGRYLAFRSRAPDLVPSDTEWQPDVFVRDLVAGVTRRISENSAGVGGNGASTIPSISADGRYVAYQSIATNLDPSGAQGILLYDSMTGQNVAVSVYPGETVARYAQFPALSADGRYVAFFSGWQSCEWFVRDLVAGVTLSVSIGPLGQPLGGSPWQFTSRPVISADGRYVGFSSTISGGPNDVNGTADVYVRDVQAGTTQLISTTPAGTTGNRCSGGCNAPYPTLLGIAISANGESVAFHSWASDLVPDDSNGFYDIFVNDTRLAPLTLTQIAPASGSELGGDRVHFFGTGFTSVSETTVRFGVTPATVVAVNPTQISVDTPPGAGLVDVVVRNRLGEATLSQAFTFIDPVLAARYGNVNAAIGPREDVLLVNAYAGDPPGRELVLGINQPILVAVAAPSNRPVSRLVVYAWPRLPGAGTRTLLPRGLGWMAMPPPFAHRPPSPAAIWNSFGYTPILGTPTHPSSPAPSVLFRSTSGVPRPLSVTFQGLIEDDGSLIPEGVSVTNAVLLRIQ